MSAASTAMLLKFQLNFIVEICYCHSGLSQTGLDTREWLLEDPTGGCYTKKPCDWFGC